MTTDNAFLAAIDAAPGDPTPRLVYADWLDDRDDPRAGLIRIEEEMAGLPVFGDRFWELKPRRNELRAAAPADWLARLGYGTVCRPVFRHGWPDGWRERWRLTREFTERWHRRPMPDVGGRQAEIAEAERGLGLELSPSLREWVAFAHDAGDLLRNAGDRPDDWLPPHRPAGAAVPLVHGSSGGYYWGVPTAELDRPDPPVYYYRDSSRLSAEWVSVAEFVVMRWEFWPRPESVGGWFRAHGTACLQRTGKSVAPSDLLRDAIGPGVRAGRVEVFEADDLVAVVWYGPPPHPFAMMQTWTARTLAPERVPAALREWAWFAGGNPRGVYARGPEGAEDDLPF